MSRPKRKTSKNTKILIGIIALLALFIVFVERPKDKYEEKQEELSAPIFENFDADKARKIEIKYAPEDLTTTLSREGKDGLWTVLSDGISYPANAKEAQEILDFLTEAVGDQIISKNPEKQERFDVTEEKGRVVAVYDKNDKDMARFIVGQPGNAFGTQLIRIPNEDNIIQVRKNLVPLFYKKPNEWRSLELFSLDASLASTFTIESQEGSLAFEKEESEWKAVSPKDAEIDSGKVDNVVIAFADLKAEDFVNGELPEESGLSHESARITAQTKNGEVYGIIVGALDEDAGLYYVQNYQNGFAYKVQSGLIDAIIVKIEELAPDKDKAEEVSEEQAVDAQ